MSIQEADLSIAHHATLEPFCIQKMNIQASDSSRAHNSTLEGVHIQH